MRSMPVKLRSEHILSLGIWLCLVYASLACTSRPISVTEESQPTTVENEAEPSAIIPPTETSSPSAIPTTTRIPFSSTAACVPTDSAVTQAVVIEITDGDTITVQFEDGTSRELRYIGMDSPERGAPFSDLATQMNEALADGKLATLIKDVSETDRYGRLLRYVFVEDIFVNYELVRQGLALAGSWPPDTSCDRYFKEAEDLARNEASGIWASSYSEETSGSDGEGISIIYIFSNGVKGDKEPDEYVEIRNDGTSAINLQGWTLADNADHTYRFPDYAIQPGEVCRIYTNEVHEEACAFNYAFSGSAIWNNSGDCAFLRDSNSNLIDDYCY